MARLRPALVLLPGMDGTGLLFEPLLAALGDDVRTIRIRYPPDQALGYAALAQLVRSELPVNEPYVLLGESFSGPIAIALAAQRPPGLMGLILCCTFARNPRPALRKAAWLAHAALVQPAARLGAAPLLLGWQGDARLRALLAQALAPVAGAVLAQRARAVLEVDVAACLATVALPIHSLQAAHDRVVPPHCAAEIARLNPRVTTHVIDGPHCLLQAAPRASAHLLRRILDEIV